MTDSVEFIVPIEPRGWARARKNGNRFFKDEKTASFERYVGYCARNHMKGVEAFEGPVILILIANTLLPASWSKKKRDAALRNEIYPTGKPDLDNIGKAVCDALNGIVYRDDAQIVTSLYSKTYSTTPGLEVRVSQVKIKSRSTGPALGGTNAVRSGREFQEDRSGAR